LRHNQTESEKKSSEINKNELLIIAVPVYMERVPALISSYLNNLKALQTPAVGIVVYGNRTYGNALLELKDILTAIGCTPIAGGAFIGEHSFSSNEFPIASSRPNSVDLEFAKTFGKELKKKLLAVDSVDDLPEVKIPGSYPYGGITELWSVDFIAISEKCTQQGICAEVCPTGAIHFRDTRIINIEKCITCCACIKHCPENARTIKESDVKKAAIRLNALFQTPKAPEIFY
jgi:Uncharacterized Fe-S center protein